MLKSGEIFSIQEFVRRAIDNELARRPQGRISEGDAQAGEDRAGADDDRGSLLHEHGGAKDNARKENTAPTLGTPRRDSRA